MDPNLQPGSTDFASSLNPALGEHRAVVTDTIQPHQKGRVRFQGSWWLAQCDQAITLNPGDEVRIVGRQNITLHVEPVVSPPSTKKSFDAQGIGSQHPETNIQSFNSLRLVIQDACSRGATDVYLQAGRPPFYRLSGELIPQGHINPLSAEQFQQYMHETLTPKQLEQYQSRRKLDIEVSIPGLMQARINCGFTAQGNEVMCLKAIALEAPNLIEQQRSSVRLIVKDVQQAIVSAAEQKEPPLLNLFTRLREAGLPLGIDEYFLVLRALEKNFGMADRNALAELCRMLWVKSKDEEHLFNYHFKQVMQTVSQQSGTSSTSAERKLPHSSHLSDVRQAVQGENPNTEELPTSSTTISQELMEVEDEMQVAEALQIATRSEGEVLINRFAQSDEYFPVTRRQMKQSWRHLRRMVREGPLVEIDVEATIERFSQQGIPFDPVLLPGRVNRTELLLLIDQKGSMVPFHALSQRLVETAQRGGRLGEAGVFYFHNCPTQHLYRDANRQQAELLKDLLLQLRPERSVVLIFSDGGAARGSFNPQRLELTNQFLAQLKDRVRYLTWLNPMAKERWVGTTAGEIAQRVPMFEMSRQGMEGAIDVLRGRSLQVVG